MAVSQDAAAEGDQVATLVPNGKHKAPTKPVEVAAARILVDEEEGPTLRKRMIFFAQMGSQSRPFIGRIADLPQLDRVVLDPTLVAILQGGCLTGQMVSKECQGFGHGLG